MNADPTFAPDLQWRADTYWLLGRLRKRFSAVQIPATAASSGQQSNLLELPEDLNNAPSKMAL